MPAIRTNYLVLPEEERGKGWRRPFRDSYRHITCGTTTTMAKPIAETFARDPAYYTDTYCAGCRMHRPVDEFRWLDGTGVGT